jgi:hypothetical protein
MYMYLYMHVYMYLNVYVYVYVYVVFIFPTHEPRPPPPPTHTYTHFFYRWRLLRLRHCLCLYLSPHQASPPPHTNAYIRTYFFFKQVASPRIATLPFVFIYPETTNRVPICALSVAGKAGMVSLSLFVSLSLLSLSR